MAYTGQRSSVSRGVMVLVIIGAALVGVAFWIGPFRPIPAELRLRVQSEGEATSAATLANVGTPDAPRFALVLALQNEGGRVAHPERVDLSVPATFRLRSNRADLQREAVPGNPLVRYQVPISDRDVPPDGTVQPLAAGDTLFLEPILHDYYCTVLADSVPEFVPAPARRPEQLASLQLYYAFREEKPAGRQAGLLQLQLDPAALQQVPAAKPPMFDVVIREPEVPRPELGTLREGGTRTAECGDPQQPIDIYTKTWETPGRGRFLVVYVSGAPRKQLYDLNRDSIIELEMWDGNGDGRYEAARPARYAIPPFLLPLQVEEVAASDSLIGSPEWQRLFGDTASGPFRFLPDSVLPPVLRPQIAVTDSVLSDSVQPGGARPDTAWLRRFNDVAAGPFRFAQNPPPRLARDSTPTAKPRRPRGPVPLGRPVPYPVAPGRPDTIPR